MKKLSFLLFAVLVSIFFGCREQSSAQPNTGTGPKPGEVEFLSIVKHPHDTNAFTQGLIYREGHLYESTGIGTHEASSLRKVEISTGKSLLKLNVPEDFFGEGLELFGEHLYMLTWRNGVCFMLEKDTFKHVKTFKYTGEGWGLTSDGKHLVLSDGTSVLRFYDPADFKLVKKVSVYDEDNRKRKKSIKDLNELEFIEGEIWANVWRTAKIARIDPESGKVIGWIDCTNLVPEELKKEHFNPRFANRVLNGIAYDKEKSRVFLTGKEWPVMYEIEIRIGE